MDEKTILRNVRNIIVKVRMNSNDGSLKSMENKILISLYDFYLNFKEEYPNIKKIICNEYPVFKNYIKNVEELIKERNELEEKLNIINESIFILMDSPSDFESHNLKNQKVIKKTSLNVVTN